MRGAPAIGLAIVAACATAPVVHPSLGAGFVEVGACDVPSDRAFDALRLDRAPRLHELVLVVPRGAVDVRELSVSFADGRVFVPRAARAYTAGSESAVIELPDAPRAIDEVILDCGRHSDGARVELWAR